jgi:hypothetical protein
LIETFRKPTNPHDYGHQGTILGGHFYNAESVRISQIGQSEHSETM